MAFADEAAHANALRFFDDMRAFVHGIEENGNVGQQAMELDGSGKAAKDRHSHIENDEVRSERESFIDGFAAVAGFAADLNVVPGKQNGTNALADGIVVVGKSGYGSESILS